MSTLTGTPQKSLTTSLLEVKLSELIQLKKTQTSLAYYDKPFPSTYATLVFGETSCKKESFERLAGGLLFVTDIDELITTTKNQFNVETGVLR